MFEVKILNKQKKILYLKWVGIVKKEEVEEANYELEKAYQEIGARPFYLIPDTRELKVFAPETKDEIVKQQQIFLPRILKVAELTKGALTKKQVEQMKEKSGNSHQEFFLELNEALRYLESISRY